MLSYFSLQYLMVCSLLLFHSTLCLADHIGFSNYLLVVLFWFSVFPVLQCHLVLQYLVIWGTLSAYSTFCFVVPFQFPVPNILQSSFILQYFLYCGPLLFTVTGITFCCLLSVKSKTIFLTQFTVITVCVHFSIYSTYCFGFLFLVYSTNCFAVLFQFTVLTILRSSFSLTTSASRSCTTSS